MIVEWSFVMSSRLGLHALAATLSAQAAAEFVAEIEVEKESRRVGGKSVLEMLMLVAGKGSALTVRACGADAEGAVQTLSKLVERTLGAHPGGRPDHQDCQP
jgi:phosphocarrier protein HPr